MAEDEPASADVPQSDASSVVAVTSARKTIPKRKLAAVTRVCALSTCNKKFHPIPSAAAKSFSGSDSFCSQVCSERRDSTSKHVEAKKPSSATAVYNRAKRQVEALREGGVSAMFAARVPAVRQSSEYVVVAAPSADQATIMQYILLGMSNPKDAKWAAPLQSIYAEAIRNGLQEGYEREFVISMKALKAKASHVSLPVTASADDAGEGDRMTSELSESASGLMPVAAITGNRHKRRRPGPNTGSGLRVADDDEDDDDDGVGSVAARTSDAFDHPLLVLGEPSTLGMCWVGGSGMAGSYQATLCYPSSAGMYGQENETSQLCWCSCLSQCLSHFITVRNTLRSIKPRATEHISRCAALIECIQRVLNNRNAACFPVSKRTFTTLADLVHRSDRSERRHEDASEALSLALNERGEEFLERVFPLVTYFERTVVVRCHADGCRHYSGGVGFAEWKSSAIAHNPLFLVSKGSVERALAHYDAKEQSPACSIEHGTFFTDDVIDLDDDTDGKLSLLVRCLNEAINPSRLALELDAPDYTYLGDNPPNRCTFCGKILPKDSCLYCSERTQFATAQRMVARAKHLGRSPPHVIVIHVERLAENPHMRIIAPDAIRLMNFGWTRHAFGDVLAPRGIVDETMDAPQSHKYVLRSVAHRSGGVGVGNSRFGHWWANLKHSKEWSLECNDSRVRAMRGMGDPRTATMFFYELSSVTEIVGWNGSS